MIGGPGDEAESHVLEHGGARIGHGGYDEDLGSMRGFAFFQRSGIGLAGIKE